MHDHKQVNAAVERFVKAGWLQTKFRAVTVLNPKELRDFAELKK